MLVTPLPSSHVTRRQSAPQIIAIYSQSEVSVGMHLLSAKLGPRDARDADAVVQRTAMRKIRRTSRCVNTLDMGASSVLTASLVIVVNVLSPPASLVDAPSLQLLTTGGPPAGADAHSHSRRIRGTKLTRCLLALQMSVSSHHGKCFCGEVELMVKGAPMFQVYCHCTDCSLRHCAPFVKGVGYKHGEGIEVVKGKESVSSFNKSGEFER